MGYEPREQILIDGLSVSTSPSGNGDFPGNTGFAIQLHWEDTDTNFTVKVQGSNLESDNAGDTDYWVDMTMNNAGTLEDETTLTGTADGTHGIQFDVFLFRFLKVVITNSSGNVGSSITAIISVIDNQIKRG